MIKVEILYQTQYAYTEPVSLSLHLFRLFPRHERHVRVHSIAFQTNLEAAVGFRRDLFDNEIASCFYPQKTALLAASMRIELSLEEKNAFGFLLAGHALQVPFDYTPEEAWALAPYRDIHASAHLPFWTPPEKPEPTIETLVSLNSAVFQNIGYERREEGEARSAAETLALGHGSCRDFAVLMRDAVRGLGLAARLASGYLCEFGKKEGEHRAEGAMHAWIEIYLPGAGWLGFDPTNGTLCNHNHITAAVGLTPADISPVHGHFYHPTCPPAQTMSATLQIHEIA